MEQLQTRHKWTIPVLILALFLLLIAVLMASGRQVSLPLTFNPIAKRSAERRCHLIPMNGVAD